MSAPKKRPRARVCASCGESAGVHLADCPELARVEERRTRARLENLAATVRATTRDRPAVSTARAAAGPTLAETSAIEVNATTGDPGADAALLAVGGVRLGHEAAAAFVARMLTHADPTVREAAQRVASEVARLGPLPDWTDVELRVAVVRTLEAAADQYAAARGETYPADWLIATEGPLAFWARHVCESIATLARDPRASGRIAKPLARATAERAITTLATPRGRGAPRRSERGKPSASAVILDVLRELGIATGNAETIRGFLRSHPARYRLR